MTESVKDLSDHTFINAFHPKSEANSTRTVILTSPTVTHAPQQHFLFGEPSTVNMVWIRKPWTPMWY